MSEKLGVSKGSYKVYLQRLRNKVGLSSLFDIVRLETEWRIEKPSTALKISLIPIMNVPLSKKEREIIKLMQNSIQEKHHLPSQKEMAYALGIAFGTFKVYVSHLLGETGLTDFEQLAFLDIGEIQSSEKAVGL